MGQIYYKFEFYSEKLEVKVNANRDQVLGIEYQVRSQGSTLIREVKYSSFFRFVLKVVSKSIGFRPSQEIYKFVK